MWYPTNIRVGELNELIISYRDKSLSQSTSSNNLILLASDNVARLTQKSELSNYLPRDWLWIGSQYRINTEIEETVRSVAGGAILLLADWLSQNNYPEKSFKEDINWLTSTTLSELCSILGSNSLRRFLSSDEETRVDDLWQSLIPKDPFDMDKIEKDMQPYLENLSNIESDTYRPVISEKINVLASYAKSNSEDADWAVSALRYLITQSDVVPDELGYLGLVDDIYVIEQAYEMVGQRSSWGALIDRFVRKWPILEQVVFDENTGPVRLSVYLQVVSGLIFHNLSSDRKRINIIVKEVGIIPLLVSFLWVVNRMRENNEDRENSEEKLESGSYVTLIGSDIRIYGIYRGTSEREGKIFHFIELQKGCRQSMHESLVEYMRLTSSRPKNLSTVKQYAQWKESIRPNPLLHVLGRDINLDELKPEVILLSQKKDLERYITETSPMGSTYGSLVGVRYITRKGKNIDYPGAPTKTPLLWCASDPLIVSGLIKESRNGEGENNARYVIIEAGKLALDLVSALAGIPEKDWPTLMVISGAHEREQCKQLLGLNYESVYITNEDVLQEDRTRLSSQRYGLMSQFNTRQHLQSKNRIIIHEIKNPEVEDLYGCLHDLRTLAGKNESLGLEPIVATGMTLLRKILRLVTTPNEHELGEMKSQVEGLKGYCGIYMSVDQNVRRLYNVLGDLTDEVLKGFGRESEITTILDGMKEERVAIVCPSIRAATNSRLATGQEEQECEVDWVTLNDLKWKDVYESVIVCGWIDRLSMREVSVGGYAKNTHIILYPFERKWEMRSRKSGIRWTKTLRSMNESQWRSIEKEFGDLGGLSNKTDKKSEMLGEADIAEKEDEEVYAETPTEWLEEHVVSVIKNRCIDRASGLDTIDASLITFHEPGYYILLPPHGKVICLSDVLDSLSNVEKEEELSGKNAETLISQKVSDITSDDLLGFPEGVSGDLLDTLADKILSDSEKYRELSALWKKALLDHMESKNLEISDIKRKLDDVGVGRSYLTVKHWLYSEGTIAPRGWKAVIPLIAKITESNDLIDNYKDVAHSIELIYDARRTAAKELVEQLRYGDLDTGSNSLTILIEGQEVSYKVLRVRSIEPSIKVQKELLGELQQLSQLDRILEALAGSKA